MYTSWQLMCKCYRFPLIFVLLLENVTCSTRRPLGPQYMSWALCVNHDVYIGPKSRLTIRFFFCVYNLNSNYFFSFFPMFSYVLFFPTTFLIVCLHLYSCSSLLQDSHFLFLKCQFFQIIYSCMDTITSPARLFNSRVLFVTYCTFCSICQKWQHGRY